MTDITAQLRALRRPDAAIWTIHYACESWFQVRDRPVGVSCIALIRISDNSAHVFSLTDAKDDAEIRLFQHFYDHLRSHPEGLLVHWNMHSSDFGFEALRNRYRFLIGEDPPFSPSEANRIDLDSVLALKFGADYADHPRLYSLADLNGFPKRFMLSGKEEAENFGAGNHGDIKRSTREKAHLIAFILRRLLNEKLVTNNSASSVSFAHTQLDAIQVVQAIAERFEYVRRQLLRRHEKRPTLTVADEYDFQDLFHSLLKLFFDDVRMEDWCPSYAGSSSRVDFVLPEVRLAVELKHTRGSMTAKSLGEELIVDSQRYKTREDIDSLMCIVLDRDARIDNPRGLERDLTGVRDGLRVSVTIVDR